MKKIQLALFSLLLSIAGFAQSKKDTICIIQMNDVYEISPLEAGKVGGLARVATIVNESKKRYKTYTVIAGDFFSPSVFGTAMYEGERIFGRQMVDVLNAVGLDFATFGNHEFDIPASAVQKRLDESKFNWISANVFGKDSLPLYRNVYFDSAKTTPTKVYFPSYFPINSEHNQFRISLFSVTLSANKQPYLYYKDKEEALSGLWPVFKKSKTIPIGLTHLYYFEDSLLMARHPEIKLIMGGHEHKNLHIQSGSGYVAKADANARTVYKHLIYLDKNKKPVIKSELIRVDEKIAKDPVVDSVVRRWEDIAYASFRKIGLEPNTFVTKLRDTLEGMEVSIRFRQNNLGDAITKSLLYNSDGECSMFNSGSVRIDDNLFGDLSELDIIRMLPFGGTVMQTSMKGSLLIEVLQTNASRIGIGAYLQYSSNLVNTANGWTINGNLIDPERYYKINTVDYLVSGKEQRLGYLKEGNPSIQYIKPLLDNNGKAIDVRSKIINYLKSAEFSK
jgi:2',3'-cyclic-nucleotide 2'-phosphodiesterase (5'-nucleotidase family)